MVGEGCSGRGGSIYGGALGSTGRETPHQPVIPTYRATEIGQAGRLFGNEMDKVNVKKHESGHVDVVCLLLV